MTWISFDKIHVWKVIRCVSVYYFLTLEEASTAAEFGTRQPTFQILVVDEGLGVGHHMESCISYAIGRGVNGEGFYFKLTMVKCVPLDPS